MQLEVGKLDAADQEALTGMHATTLHRLLGSRPDTSARFRHNRGNRLPHDVIVVDETSMVSLTMMARLLEAVRPDARLILVGDPDQLASVEAGAVLADLVDGLGESKLAALKTSHRFGESIGALASAIRDGDADAAIEVLRAGGEHIEWIDTDEPAEHLRTVVVPQARRLREAAILGDADAALRTLDEHRLLCAHRRGPYGVRFWNRQVERWLSEETGEPIWSAWYAGRPVLVTANDYGLGLYNGDTGVTVVRDGVLRAVIAGTEQQEFATSRLVGRRHHARDDDSQEPGQPGRRGHGAVAAGGFAAADAGAVLHRGHPGQDAHPGDRARGGGAGGRRAAGRAGVGAGAPAYALSALPLRHTSHGTLQSPFCASCQRRSAGVVHLDDVAGDGEVEEPLGVLAAEIQAAVGDVGVSLRPDGVVELVQVDAVHADARRVRDGVLVGSPHRWRPYVAESITTGLALSSTV